MNHRVEIRVRGTVPDDAAERLGMEVSTPRSDTVLRGSVPDRPALLGVLDRLRCDGIELVDVRRLPDAGA
ncbi:MAG TPA: hypothetical protein VNS09_27035 [Solirubrobacter sp.]|nr:hypothetical protein [Solirubrobacter sp.]